jgi:hypothetical protein
MLLLPLAATCVLATGICLARVTWVRAADGTARVELRLVAADRDRRADAMQMAAAEAQHDADEATRRTTGPGEAFGRAATPATRVARAAAPLAAPAVDQRLCPPHHTRRPPRGPPAVVHHGT